GLHSGDDSTTVSLVPSASSSSVNSPSPSSSHSKARRRSGSTSVTVAWRSSPFDQRKLAPPPGRRSRSTSFANQSASRSGSVSASHTSSRGAGRTISLLIMCNLQVALECATDKLHVTGGGGRDRGFRRSDGRRAGRALGALVRHLLAPAARAHRFPGPGGGRPDREPDRGAAPPSRRARSRTRHLSVRQLAGRLSLRRNGDLRRDAVR